jgi:purine-nucleoside/S-methyl-5'-thioadenosine phosphorylase / adenosine deaminase
MSDERVADIPLQRFAALSALTGIDHAFVLRVPGIEVNVDREIALRRLEAAHQTVRARFGARSYRTAQQIHGCAVVRVDRSGPAQSAGVDALVTNDPGVLLGIYVADCCAIYLVDARSGVLGLAHSGRKGTQLNVVSRTLDLMHRSFSTNPADVVAQLSPCIRPPYYEIDFAAAIREQLQSAGVEHIYDTGENTGADLSRYYSYRVEKGRTGRMLALLGFVEARS